MQTAIVTGGNSGLGYQCARAIAAASSQWHVLIAGTTPSRIEGTPPCGIRTRDPRIAPSNGSGPSDLYLANLGKHGKNTVRPADWGLDSDAFARAV
jgi:NAD(P)-dependent dehydrogenase (short-subunit alcohol dehydrogenase family)